MERFRQKVLRQIDFYALVGLYAETNKHFDGGIFRQVALCPDLRYTLIHVGG
jgi:hypothetical protein